ncbi:MAG TPA: 16S rRNA (guanine(966)-N(2))-methyltransferase RsmD [Steroidobacteraceae bacterium]|nr:16S rRNA (guanine(966)-N(2))-methyltransferase RsmD [Steroidobacteraceae bacterium]
MSRKTPRRQSRTPQPRRPSALRNELRIIGGNWRGRRVKFAPLPELRPTPDRVRETLFNWLQLVIAGSRCLDLYAGSGALGLEALSRGAARVLFIDREAAVIEQLRSTLSVLKATGGELQLMQASRYLESRPEPFDIVFLDPPFADESLPAICATLEARGWLAPGAFIYIERRSREGPPSLPSGWSLHRTGRAGEVGYHLARRQAAPTAQGEMR